LLAFIDYVDPLQPWAQVGEVGSTRASDDRSTVETGRTYEDPVVVTTGDGTANPRVRDTGAGGFEVAAGGGRLGYAVVERGRHTIGTTAVEAGRASPDGWETVTFAEPFDRLPAVLTDTQPTGRGMPKEVRVRNITRAGFEARLDGPGSVGYLAVEPGDLTARGRRGVAGRAAVDGRGTVGFDRTFRNRPVALVSAQTPGRGSVAAPQVETDGLTVAGDGVVGYLALQPGGLQASVSSTVSVPAVESQVQAGWERLAEQSAVDTLPDQPPGVAGSEPLATGHESVKSQLLDTYERFVVFGHTHVPDRGDRYANAGPWTTRGPNVTENNYVEILDGEVTVWDWSGPGEREPLFE